jgi:hypothetical protein
MSMAVVHLDAVAEFTTTAERLAKKWELIEVTSDTYPKYIEFSPCWPTPKSSGPIQDLLPRGSNAGVTWSRVTGTSDTYPKYFENGLYLRTPNAPDRLSRQGGCKTEFGRELGTDDERSCAMEEPGEVSEPSDEYFSDVAEVGGEKVRIPRR